MNIQQLKTKYAKLGAEIERLEQPEGVWEPTVGGTFWMVDWTGGVRSLNPNNRAAVSHHNVYETEDLAQKAGVLQLRSNLVIQACLNVDPHFVPDWNDLDQTKYGFYYAHEIGEWFPNGVSRHNVYGAYVSTALLAEKVVAYLNNQEVK